MCFRKGRLVPVIAAYDKVMGCFYHIEDGVYSPFDDIARWYEIENPNYVGAFAAAALNPLEEK